MDGDMIVAQAVPRHGAKARRLLQASDGGNTKPSKPPKDPRPNKHTPPQPQPQPLPPTPALTPVPVSSPPPILNSVVGPPPPAALAPIAAVNATAASAPTATLPPIAPTTPIAPTAPNLPSPPFAANPPPNANAAPPLVLPNASPPAISTSPAPVSRNSPPPFHQVSATSTPSSGGGGTSHTAVIIIIVVVVSVVVGAIVVLIACCRRGKGRDAAKDGLPPGGKNGSQPSGPGGTATGTRSADTFGGTSAGSSVEKSEEAPMRGSQFGGSRKVGAGVLAAFGMGHLGGGGGAIFTPAEIEKATNHFSDDNFLGKGGFGKVYRGVTNGGQEIAVKVLADSGDGEREFMREARIISQVHHRNLVTLYGCCVAENTRMLILEYVPGGTLMDNLARNMDWSSRVRVILGVAKGLAYLHHDCEPRIFHRDIKSENILIDAQMVAKVADFGLAKLASGSNTHTTTRVMGSPGYVAPEYVASGQVSSAADVFSFGVVVLEAVSGQRANDRRQPLGQQTLYKRAHLLLEVNRLEELIDRRLQGRYDEASMRRMIETASYCIREAAHLRPTMAEAVQMLQGHQSDALRRLRETEPGSSGRESAGSVGVSGGEVTSAELLSQPWQAASGTMSSTVSERTQTLGSASASPNPTLDFGNDPSSMSWAQPGRSATSSGMDPEASAYPSQPDFRSPSGLLSQQFDGYQSEARPSMGTRDLGERSSSLREIKEGSTMPPSHASESADFSTYTPSVTSVTSQKGSREGIVFTSEFSLPKNTERLSSDASGR